MGISWFFDERRADGVNIALIILSCVLAHMMPYYLFLFSYSILGSAHYLTQISWMHDRNYFVQAPSFAPLCIILTLFLMLSPSPNISAVLLIAAIAIAAACLFSARRTVLVPSILAGVLIGYLLMQYVSPFAIFLAALLPTILHVFVFTVGFMWSGALKTGRRYAYLSLFLLIAGAATFFIVKDIQQPPSLAVLALFQPGVNYLKTILPPQISEAQIFGFASFVYTYHYLNWFSKAEVIHWNRIPRRRLYAILALYVGILGVYVCNYIAGFMLSLALSLLHVLMEFPLNLRTFATIGSTVFITTKAHIQSKT